MKEILLSLKASLQVDSPMYKNKKHGVHDLDFLIKRVNNVEEKLSEFFKSFNALVDAHTVQKEDASWLKAKIA